MSIFALNKKPLLTLKYLQYMCGTFDEHLYL